MSKEVEKYLVKSCGCEYLKGFTPEPRWVDDPVGAQRFDKETAEGLASLLTREVGATQHYQAVKEPAYLRICVHPERPNYFEGGVSFWDAKAYRTEKLDARDMKRGWIAVLKEHVRLATATWLDSELYYVLLGRNPTTVARIDKSPVVLKPDFALQGVESYKGSLNLFLEPRGLCPRFYQLMKNKRI